MQTTILDRIKELTSELEQSAAHHNALIGRLQEAKEMLVKISPIIEDDELTD